MEKISVMLLHCANGKNYRVGDKEVLDDFSRTGTLPVAIQVDNYSYDSKIVVNRDFIVAIEYWTE